MVVKVFAKHDPSLNLGPYEKRLHGKQTHWAYTNIPKRYLPTDVVSTERLWTWTAQNGSCKYHDMCMVTKSLPMRSFFEDILLEM